MPGEIQKQLNILSGTLAGTAVAAAKGLAKPEKSSGQVFTDVKPGLVYTPVYDSESAAIKATAMANEAIKAKEASYRSRDSVTGRFIKKEEGGSK